MLENLSDGDKEKLDEILDEIKTGLTPTQIENYVSAIIDKKSIHTNRLYISNISKQRAKYMTEEERLNVLAEYYFNQ